MSSSFAAELRVLIIEDSVADATLMQREIEKQGYTLVARRVENETELRAALVAPWDIVLSDFRLPQLNAIFALEILKELQCDIPFIVVSQAIGEDLAVELMRSGASDYIMKASLKRLTPAIERELRENRSRHQALRRLRDHENFLESVIHNQLSGIIVVNKLGEITLTNASAEQILQMRKDPVTGAIIDERGQCTFIDMDNEPLDRDNLPIALALRTGKKISAMQYGVIFPRGNLKWLSVSASPITDEAGSLSGVVCSCLEITEIIETQKRNRFQLQQLKLQDEAFNNLMNGVIIISAKMADMPVVYVNRAFTRITGYEAHEVLGHNYKSLQRTEPDQPGLAAMYAKMQNGEGGEFLVRNLKKDGTVFYARINTAAVRNEAGEIDHFVAIQNDVTQRILIEKQLEIGWERMQLALRGAQLGMIDVDHETKQTYYSSRFAEIVGYSAAELHSSIGSWHDLIHPDELAATDQLSNDLLSGKIEKLETEIRFRHKDGHWVWVLVRAKVVERLANGNSRRAIGTVLDISQRKEQEEKILELTQSLMQIAEAERSEISGELHDVVGQSLVLLKLNIIQFLQAAGMRNESNENTLVQPIADTLQKLREISRRLTPSHMQKVGLGLAIEDMLQGAAKLSGIRIVWNLNALEGFFPSDWNIQVFRVIQESVTNALKHAEATEIHVTTKRLEENLEIVIADNGRGFAGKTESSGLGLSLMRERVRGLRGHIFWQQGQPGTSVHVVLPATTADLGSST
jgi:PAS domain S-box-containing protein